MSVLGHSVHSSQHWALGTGVSVSGGVSTGSTGNGVSLSIKFEPSIGEFCRSACGDSKYGISSEGSEIVNCFGTTIVPDDDADADSPI